MSNCTGKCQYIAALARIVEKAKRLDAFFLQAGTAKAAEKTASAMPKQPEDIDKAIQAALNIEDGLDYLLTYITEKEKNIS